MREEILFRENGSKRVIFHFDDPSLTRQEFKEECDLAKIIARFSATPDGMQALEASRSYVEGRFLDLSEVSDYRGSLEAVKAADEAFMRLPAQVRSRFDNDPAKFLDFVDSPGNEQELRNLGLLNPKVEDSGKPLADQPKS